MLLFYHQATRYRDLGAARVIDNPLSQRVGQVYLEELPVIECTLHKDSMLLILMRQENDSDAIGPECLFDH